MKSSEIKIKVPGNIVLTGNLNIPDIPQAFVIFSHGSGSSRFSPRNRQVADVLNQNRIATLLTDLLTEDEDKVFENRFNIELLADRLEAVTKEVIEYADLVHLPAGYFGASTGAASAIKAAVRLPETIKAVVSRGGRPDLAGDVALSKLNVPTLFIVGGQDDQVIVLNEQAYMQLNCEKKLQIVEGATHLFEEPGKLDEVARIARSWFNKHLIVNQKTSIIF